ncbi:HupE/UreJ family protein [Methylomonas sp. 2BW1-5-20]|uniref:HupE/UreJ family protein n=1 Tax=Methylomonas sp. 2BW1-5-20 TaxID=3376686 RepID=UPI004050E0BC
MKSDLTSKLANSGRSPGKLLLSCGLPVLLLLAFLGKQFIDFDSIGWSNGFNHPLMGLDHLVTMLAVGIWAAQLRGKAIWVLPVAFVGVMSLGGLAGASGLAIPSVEGIILLSCAVFSVLITRKVRFSTKVNVLIVSFFAFFHGFAHGQEISASASLISYTLGFMLATLLLHGAGILVAKLVVFCATCLLTAMFANAALAKSDGAIRNEKHNGAATLVQTDDLHNAAYWMAYIAAGLREASLLEQQRTLAAASEPCQDAGMGVGAVTERLNLSSNVSSSGDHAAVHQRLAKPQPVQAPFICLDRAIFDGDHLVNAGLDFKHYYRDVNHTPGKHLLSNGVGLTSPPVRHVLAPQAVQNLRTTPISAIEELHLQAIFAKFATGNYYKNTINHICTIAHRLPALRRDTLPAAALVPRCFLTALAPISNSDQANLPLTGYPKTSLPIRTPHTLAAAYVGGAVTYRINCST